MSTKEKMRLIVGLGNPGDKYIHTRHNVGFLVLDAYLSSEIWSSDHSSLIHKREGTIFCKPMTFMNLSGDAIGSIQRYFKIKNEDILVIVDDLYLPEGKFKLGINKNDGGHNGLKNIIDRLGGKDFCTLRVGIGPRDRADSISEYVLENFSKESLKKLENLYPEIFKILEDFSIGTGITQLQNKYNK